MEESNEFSTAKNGKRSEPNNWIGVAECLDLRREELLRLCGVRLRPQPVLLCLPWRRVPSVTRSVNAARLKLAASEVVRSGT